ncbi:EAL domain-containing protein [Vibrio sp. IRLE0018]|uniref:EAL domain-containing protein n=1 Tax=Vibrio TaxID=662 RepID=UPI0015941531|nr:MULTISPECIES: EAL domain-containing protein [Vibrio]MCF8777725.1 EAL domain-containing protein [Vibrio floridensis]NVC61713.1 EAL domain-containing protein [Vibrio sp. 05-20-BW147]HAS6346875.1 EAL domain-containing protein [Vibrio vulnificus]
MKILIVEDERIQSTSLKLKLGSLNYSDIQIAENGEDALTLCEENTFALIFCDIHMPEMDGISLLTILSERGYQPGIVILSAVEDAVLELTRNMCSLARFPFVDVLKKPFSMEALFNVINSYTLSKQRLVVPKTDFQVSCEDLEFAFENDQIFNFYQPQYDFATGAMVGVEALVRLKHPQYGLLAPAAFLPVIEQCNWMDRLFWRVLEKAISAIASMSDNLKLSVNISQNNLQQPMCDRVIELCHHYGFEPNRLSLELTEDQVYNGTTISLANLARLRMHGVGLSIDDFGTGYASLSQLGKLPFNELKIDKGFVFDLVTNYKHQQLTKMCLMLAQSLGLHCVVEGVEDEETWQYLRNLGVDTCQGYYSSPPLPIAELSEQYAKNQSRILTQESIEGGICALIIADCQVSAIALQKQLQREESVSQVRLASSLDQAIKKLRDYPINLVLMDIRFASDVSENELILGIDEQYKGRMILLSEHSDAESVQLPQLQSGSTILSKGSTLVDTVSHIVADTKLDKTDYSAQQSQLEQLSERELAVAQMLFKGLSNKQIANQLDINQKTVSTYKTRVQTKLGIRSAMELVRFFTLD